MSTNKNATFNYGHFPIEDIKSDNTRFDKEKFNDVFNFRDFKWEHCQSSTFDKLQETNIDKTINETDVSDAKEVVFSKGGYDFIKAPLFKEFSNKEIDYTSKIVPTIGYKETEGKLNYELDWSFIRGMAEKMAVNKGKYEPNNYKKYIDIELLKQSLTRHVISILEGDYIDDNRAIGHLESAALNLMMISYQIKHHKQK